MRIAFLVHRLTYFKYFGSLVEEAIDRGEDVFLLLDHRAIKDDHKSYDWPDAERVPAFRRGRPETVSLAAEHDLITFVIERKVDALVTIHFAPGYAPLREAIKKQRKQLRWVAIQHGFDTFAHRAVLPFADLVLVYTDTWKRWLLDTGFGRGTVPEDAGFADRIVPVGTPEFAQHAMIDAREVRARWRIPPHKQVVLLLPYPFQSNADRWWGPRIYGGSRLEGVVVGLVTGHPRWIKQAVGSDHDIDVMRGIRDFCDREDAWLIVKSRRKDAVRPYLESYADRVFYDESHYPATIYECLAVSSLCIHFLSSGILEAAAQNVFSLCISPDLRDLKDFNTPFGRLYWQHYKQVIDQAGINRKVDLSRVRGLLSDSSLSNFKMQPEAHDRFAARFLGPLDGKAPARALEAIASAVSAGRE